MKTRLLYFLPDELAKRQPIVLFDGDCNLCNHSVKFLIKNNPKKNLSFTSLQSVSAKRILSLAGKSFQHADSIMYLNKNTLSAQSTAVLNIASHLGFFWQVLVFFRIVPQPFRDSLYTYVAINRDKWFRKKSPCLFSNEHAERFIN